MKISTIASAIAFFAVTQASAQTFIERGRASFESLSPQDQQKIIDAVATGNQIPTGSYKTNPQNLPKKAEDDDIKGTLLELAMPSKLVEYKKFMRKAMSLGDSGDSRFWPANNRILNQSEVGKQFGCSEWSQVDVNVRRVWFLQYIDYLRASLATPMEPETQTLNEYIAYDHLEKYCGRFKKAKVGTGVAMALVEASKVQDTPR